MPDYCTCGAQLPDDARFCHKCGKPQGEELSPEPETELPPLVLTPVAVTAQPSEINFRNRIAVRVGFLVAGLVILASTFASLLGSLPAQFFAFVVLFLFSGFLSVYLYMRRTGQALSVRNGARLGWITGVFSFVISTVLFTVGLLSIGGISGLASAYRQQSSSLGLPEQAVERVLEVLQNPGAMTLFLLLLLLTQFVIYTTVASVGGALGAKVLEKE